MFGIGFNPNLPIPGGCGAHKPAAPLPAGGPFGMLAGAGHGFGMPSFDLGSFELPDDPGAMFGGERFISSSTGGVIIGKDGAPAGRIPEGSFVDTKDGKLYGPDSKPITLPEGATADFFDLPDIETLLADVRGSRATPGTTTAATTAAGGDTSDSDADGHTTAPGKTAVAGSSGPGASKAGAGSVAGDSGCGMDHGPGGTKGGGAIPVGRPQALSQLLNQLHGVRMPRPGMPMHAGMHAPGMYPPGLAAGFNPMVHGGGLGTGVLGAHGLGTIPSLHASLMDLVTTLDQLAKALQATTAGGGTPAQKPTASEVAGAASTEAATTNAKAEAKPEAKPEPDAKPDATAQTEAATTTAAAPTDSSDDTPSTTTESTTTTS